LGSLKNSKELELDHPSSNETHQPIDKAKNKLDKI
jgi:hypothetical protein